MADRAAMVALSRQPFTHKCNLRWERPHFHQGRVPVDRHAGTVPADLPSAPAPAPPPPSGTPSRYQVSSTTRPGIFRSASWRRGGTGARPRRPCARFSTAVKRGTGFKSSVRALSRAAVHRTTSNCPLPPGVGWSFPDARPGPSSASFLSLPGDRKVPVMPRSSRHPRRPPTTPRDPRRLGVSRGADARCRSGWPWRRRPTRW